LYEGSRVFLRYSPLVHKIFEEDLRIQKSIKRSKPMKVAIGSTNPVKVRACKKIMRKIYGNIEVIPVSVSSGVSHTPLSHEEMIEGAKNRAFYALKKTNADMAVGMEGGISETDGKFFLSGWTVVLSKNGKIGIGGGSKTELPNFIVKEVRKGKELGNVMDELIGEKDTKKKMGAVGILTKGLIDRQKSWEISLTYALAKFLRSDLFERDEQHERS